MFKIVRHAPLDMAIEIVGDKSGNKAVEYITGHVNGYYTVTDDKYPAGEDFLMGDGKPYRFDSITTAADFCASMNMRNYPGQVRRAVDILDKYGK